MIFYYILTVGFNIHLFCYDYIIYYLVPRNIDIETLALAAAHGGVVGILRVREERAVVVPVDRYVQNL